MAQLRAGSATSRVDVYIRFGEWPTTQQYDAKLSSDPSGRVAKFVLQANRLFNDRMCVLVVGRGGSWVEYSLSANAAPNALLGLALLLAAAVIAGACALAMHLRLRSRPTPEAVRAPGMKPGFGQRR